METIKTQMKSKFLQVCTGISMVLVAGSLFVFSVSRVTASEPSKTETPAYLMKKNILPNGMGEYPFGIVNGYAYWLEFDGSNWSFNKKAITDFK